MSITGSSMRIHGYIFLISFLVVACSTTTTLSTSTAEPSPVSPTRTPVPLIPSEAPTVEGSIEDGPPITQAGPASILPPLNQPEVAYDLVEHVCDAKWSNNGQYLACPGDPGNTINGYVGRIDDPVSAAGLPFGQPALLTIPAYSGSFGGIFGEYPQFLVQTGDRFMAYLACDQDPAGCSVNFALEYYDEAGTYHEFSGDIPGPSGGKEILRPIDVDLSALSGQTVRFMLVVRSEGELKENRALWVSPYIWRTASP